MKGEGNMAARTTSARGSASRKGKTVTAAPTVSGKLKEVSGKMLDIQKEEETELVALLKEIEAITRDTMNMENEIRRQNLLRGNLEAGRRNLQKELEGLGRQNRIDENKKNEAEKQRIKLLDQNAKLKSEVSSLQDDVARLQKENSALSVEIEKLSTAKGDLKSDVERLTALRDEYMKSIAEFKRLREDLLP
jgi:chromosome segregation ATPase